MSFQSIFAVYSLFLVLTGKAADAMPDKLAALKLSYDAAMIRATAPITQTYVQELQKLKTEYTKAGNLEAALAVDAILKETMAATPGSAAQAASGPSFAGKKLSKMTIEEFKAWLTTVSIVEGAGQKTVFQYDGTAFTSVQGPSFAPRTHKGVEIELGKIVVPFSTDICVIRIAESLKSAEVRYDTEEPINAKISAKAKP